MIHEMIGISVHLILSSEKGDVELDVRLPAIPRIGDTIYLNDDTTYWVETVYWSFDAYDTFDGVSVWAENTP